LLVAKRGLLRQQPPFTALFCTQLEFPTYE